jgi:hypothetical protein
MVEQVPKYKLWLPAPGYTIGDEGGDTWVRAQNVDEAWIYILDNICEENSDWIDWRDGDDHWIHSGIAGGRIVYKSELDREEGGLPEDMEPGQTVFDLFDDTGRELASNEVRVWLPGPATPHWSITPPGWTPNQQKGVLVVDRTVSLYNSLRAAEKARTVCIARWIEQWKAAHPENHRDLPPIEEE